MRKSEGYDVDLFVLEHEGGFDDFDRVDLANDACMPVESKALEAGDWNSPA